MRLDPGEQIDHAHAVHRHHRIGPDHPGVLSLAVEYAGDQVGGTIQRLGVFGLSLGYVQHPFEADDLAHPRQFSECLLELRDGVERRQRAGRVTLFEVQVAAQLAAIPDAAGEPGKLAILTLQKILGHSSLAMTMRYAHLAPEHLAEALRLNPLSGTSWCSSHAKEYE